MRNFIVSDLHGNGQVYDSIMNFLDNVNCTSKEKVTLHILGDLIDRGDDSARMLLDIYDRITNNYGIKINYLGGNHELMMYQASLLMYNNMWYRDCDWFYGNGGEKTAFQLQENVSIEEELKMIDFVSNLKIYHKFHETINGKKIVLVHAACPDKVYYDCKIKIADNNRLVYNSTWTRKYDFWTNQMNYLGNDKYFTIIGHTPVGNKFGYEYYEEDNCLNIDGGCSCYILGSKSFDHVPLVEIDENRLIILTFNNNNEITYGNYFDGKNNHIMHNDVLEEYRKYLNKKAKVKKRK